MCSVEEASGEEAEVLGTLWFAVSSLCLWEEHAVTKVPIPDYDESLVSARTFSLDRSVLSEEEKMRMILPFLTAGPHAPSVVLKVARELLRKEGYVHTVEKIHF